MKKAERNIQAVKHKPFWSKIYSIYHKDKIYLDIWRRAYKCTEWIIFKLLCMLPLKTIFQSLDGKYFLFYFTWNFSYIHAKSAISQQVVYKK